MVSEPDRGLIARSPFETQRNAPGTAVTREPGASGAEMGWASRLAVRRLIVYAVLWAWIAAMVGLVVVASGQKQLRREVAVMEVVRGEGAMSTGRFELSRGLHRVEWDAPCVLDVELWRQHRGEDLFVLPLGRRSSKAVTVPIAVDGSRYFLSVGAACAWEIGIR